MNRTHIIVVLCFLLATVLGFGAVAFVTGDVLHEVLVVVILLFLCLVLSNCTSTLCSCTFLGCSLPTPLMVIPALVCSGYFFPLAGVPRWIQTAGLTFFLVLWSFLFCFIVLEKNAWKEIVQGWHEDLRPIDGGREDCGCLQAGHIIVLLWSALGATLGAGISVTVATGEETFGEILGLLWLVLFLIILNWTTTMAWTHSYHNGYLVCSIPWWLCVGFLTIVGSFYIFVVSDPSPESKSFECNYLILLSGLWVVLSYFIYIEPKPWIEIISEFARSEAIKRQRVTRGDASVNYGTVVVGTVVEE